VILKYNSVPDMLNPEFELLAKHILKRVNLSEEELNFMVSQFKLTRIKKRQFIVQPGFTAKHRNFVCKGFFRAYVVLDNGADHTIQYAYFLGFPFIRSFSKNTNINELIYGVFIWVFMNYIILPYSKIPQSPKDIVSIFELIWHSALVGLPMALVVERYYRLKMVTTN
jgi:hypothetical protein